MLRNRLVQTRPLSEDRGDPNEWEYYVISKEQYGSGYSPGGRVNKDLFTQLPGE